MSIIPSLAALAFLICAVGGCTSNDAPAPADNAKRTEPAPPPPPSTSPPVEPEPPKAPEFVKSLQAMAAVKATVSDDKSGKLVRVKLGRELGRVTLNEIHFVDENRAYATGSHRTLLETRNGGKKWRTVETSRSAMRDTHGNVVFVSADEGLTVQGSLLKRTGDGGKSWEPSPLPRELSRIAFTDKDNGWGLARDTLMRSKDGGKTWKGIFMPSYSFFDDVYIGADGKGWLMGHTSNRLAVWRSEDGGETWNKVIGLEGDQNHGAAGMSTVGGDEIWLSGRNYVIFSKDGGQSWSRLDGLTDKDVVFEDVVVSGDNLYLTGFEPAAQSSFLWVSSDSGATWKVIDTGLSAGQVLTDLELVGDSLWAAGAGLYRVKK